MRHIRSEGFQAVALNYRGLTSELKTPKVACAAGWEDLQEVAEHILTLHRRKSFVEDIFGLFWIDPVADFCITIYFHSDL